MGIETEDFIRAENARLRLQVSRLLRKLAEKDDHLQQVARQLHNLEAMIRLGLPEAAGSLESVAESHRRELEFQASRALSPEDHAAAVYAAFREGSLRRPWDLSEAQARLKECHPEAAETLILRWDGQ